MLNKDTLEKQLQPVIKDAYYQAKLTTMPEASGDFVNILQKSNDVYKSSIEKEANKFSDILSKELSKIITDYIKTASITCNITTPLQVTTSIGLATAIGTIPESSFKIY